MNATRMVAGFGLAMGLTMLGACRDQRTPASASASAVPAPVASAADRSNLVVEGSGFALTLPEGRVLRGTELAGATLELALADGQVAPVRLASIMPDPDHPDILRHDFQSPDDHGGWRPTCTPNAYGERWGFPVSLPEGHPGREGRITISCASGAVVKCARFGYPPWRRGPNGEDLLPLHAACMRMVRADYCGDGTPWTKEGTVIDNYDDLGIQTRGLRDDPRHTFEAGWTAAGAVCVAHTRWSDLTTTAQLEARCPRLAAVPLCTEDTARALGARMFNHSRELPAP